MATVVILAGHLKNFSSGCPLKACARDSSLELFLNSECPEGFLQFYVAIHKHPSAPIKELYITVVM